MFRIVARESAAARATARKSPFTIVMLAPRSHVGCRCPSHPDSACANAGASLIPSPPSPPLRRMDSRQVTDSMEWVACAWTERHLGCHGSPYVLDERFAPESNWTAPFIGREGAAAVHQRGVGLISICGSPVSHDGRLGDGQHVAASDLASAPRRAPESGAKPRKISRVRRLDVTGRTLPITSTGNRDRDMAKTATR